MSSSSTSWRGWCEVRRTLGIGLVALLALSACSGESAPGTPTVTASTTATSPAPGTPDPSPSDSSPAVPKVVGTVARDLAVPWGLDFLPNGDAVVTERDTRRVLLISGPDHVVRELGVIDAAAPQGEGGLLGVAVSPDFDTDRLLFFYVTTGADNRIVRATYRGGDLGEPEVILAGIPNGFIHDGGRLAFGPDGNLYASTGETGDPDIAQDLDSLGGKILRITPDGDPAEGNPIEGSPIWSYGHRNVQGLAFDDRDRLWASEFGAQDFDELNLIEAGQNYGWPLVEGRGEGEGLVNPRVVWSTDVASPSGLAYAEGSLWLASLRGQRLWRIEVGAKGASSPTDFFVGGYGRMRTVALAPDGRLWVATSNQDGRGDPAEGDDRILLIDLR